MEPIERELFRRRNFGPDPSRVAEGVKHRKDRLKALGNAIVPQVAYQILRSIMEVEQHELTSRV